MTTLPMHWGAEALWQQLLPLLPGLSVEVVERAASTNSLLLERARVVGRPDPDNAEVLVHRSVESRAFGRRAADIQPCLLVAEQQTGGRGRQGRGWQSAAGASLTFSLSLPLALQDWSGLSLAIGLALAEALDRPAAGAAPRIALKWPNDLWLLDGPLAEARGRKLGGVLIETVSAGSTRLAVIGIGLNVKPLPGVEVPGGIASLDELWPEADPPAALDKIALPLVGALRRFERDGFGPLQATYEQRDLLRGQGVRMSVGQPSEGVARGVDAVGALRVETPDGIVAVTSGEVSVRLRGSGDTVS